MEAVKAGSSVAYTPSAAKNSSPTEKPEQAEQRNSVAKVESTKVTLSEEGKALLSALQEIESAEKKEENKDKSVGDKVEAFTHGALGMDHPEKIKEEKDDSYSAGQYFSGAATIGAILLALA
jgi:hypothetical protein